MSYAAPRHRPLAVVAALAIVFALSAVHAPSAHAQGDTAVVVVNTRDGSSLFRTLFQIRHVMSDVVETSNAAVAYASCTDCQTIAVSFQIVLANSAAEITPENLALAVNEECSACLTVAHAYQFVVASGDSPLRFSAEGNRTLAELRQRLQRLRTSSPDAATLQTELDAIAEEIRVVLANELKSTGDAGNIAGDQDGDVAESPSQSPAPAPTGSASPAPTDSASPTPTDSPSPTPTDSPSPTPTGSASPAPTDGASPAPTDGASPAPIGSASPTPTSAS